jgi:hypothetical protein
MADKTYRVRFGFRHGHWLLPRNAFIAVLKDVPHPLYRELLHAVSYIRILLEENGYRDLAERIVMEAE